jgi:hypothetical protein
MQGKGISQMSVILTDSTLQAITAAFSAYDPIQNHAPGMTLRDVAENEQDPLQQQILKLSGNLITMHFKPEDIDEPYCPMWISNGRRSFSLCDMNDSDKTILQALADTDLPIPLQVIVCDVLWIVNRDFVRAQKAVDLYLMLFEEYFDPNGWTTCADYIRRANVITKQLGNGTNALKTVSDKIDEKIRLLNGTDLLFLSIVLIELQIDNGCTEHFNNYLSIAESIIADGFSKGGNDGRFIHAFDIKEKLLKKLNLHSQVNSHMLRLAKFYEDCADAEGKLAGHTHRAVLFLKNAIQIYTKYGDRDKADLARRKMEPFQQIQIDSMQPITQEIDISSITKHCKAQLVGKDIAESLIALVNFTGIINKQKQRNDTLDMSTKFLHRMFASEELGSDGKTVITLPPVDPNNIDESVLKQHMHRDMLRTQQIYGASLNAMLHYIREEHLLTINDLDFIFDNNAVIPNNRADIIKKGLFYGLSGEYYLALHILAPQVENIFREIARECGALVTAYEVKDGSEQAKALSSVFDLPELVDSYDENILFTFQGLLNEKAGANIRNRICHGIIEPNEGASAIAVYFICVCLKLFALYSPESLDMIIQSKRLCNEDQDNEEQLR